MENELAALAGAGAAALVAAMATELWQSTRGGVVGLFRRAGRRRRAEVASRLDDHAALVEGAAAPDEVRRALVDSWTTELAALLNQEPSCRESLARLVEEVRGALPDQHGGLFSHHVQTNTAHDSGTVFAVQGGEQSVRWTSGGTQPPAGREA